MVNDWNLQKGGRLLEAVRLAIFSLKLPIFLPESRGWAIIRVWAIIRMITVLLLIFGNILADNSWPNLTK